MISAAKNLTKKEKTSAFTMRPINDMKMDVPDNYYLYLRYLFFVLPGDWNSEWGFGMYEVT